MFQLLKNSNSVVKQIHNEIDLAQDRLLSEAVKIISSTSEYEEKKSQRLTKSGFINSEIVLKRKSIIESREQANLIEYYKQSYPFQKFITESEMDKICKKYSLVYAPVSAYKKDVPEKNLKEIECVPPLKGDLYPKDIKWCELKRDNSFSLLSSDGDDWCGIWGREWYRIPQKIEGVHFHSHFDANEYLKNILGFKTRYLIKQITNYVFHKDGLFIAAPKSHFNLKDLKKQGQYGMLKSSFTIIEPKDPIVFRYCRGGMQIITKWGLEASDEMIINQKEN